MLFMPSVIVPFVKMCRERGVATVAVGFPATRLVEERARFCLSAGHTKEMLDKVLQVIDEVGEYIGIKYASNLVRNRDQIIIYWKCKYTKNAVFTYRTYRVKLVHHNGCVEYYTYYSQA